MFRRYQNSHPHRTSNWPWVCTMVRRYQNSRPYWPWMCAMVMKKIYKFPPHGIWIWYWVCTMVTKKILKFPPPPKLKLTLSVYNRGCFFNFDMACKCQRRPVALGDRSDTFCCFLHELLLHGLSESQAGVSWSDFWVSKSFFRVSQSGVRVSQSPPAEFHNTISKFHNASFTIRPASCRLQPPSVTIQVSESILHISQPDRQVSQSDVNLFTKGFFKVSFEFLDGSLHFCKVSFRFLSMFLARLFHGVLMRFSYNFFVAFF